MLLCAENLIIFGNNSQWKKEVKNLADCIENIFNKTMTPEEFVKKLQNKALEVERYATLEFPNVAGNLAVF